MQDDRAEALATAYDAHTMEREEAGEPEWRSPIRAAFAAMLPEAARVLEIGSGVGFSARWFAEQGFEITATDLSPGNVAKCREKGVTALVRDVADLRFEPGSFDAVWAASCLMHVADADLPAALAGIGSVLVPGGLFWAGTWGGVDREGAWENDWYEPKRFYSLRSHERMRRMYEDAGFAVLSFETLDARANEPDWVYQSALLQAV